MTGTADASSITSFPAPWKSFVLNCLKHALSNRKPEIINSDQGGHFTNPDYIELLEEANIKISMDGKGQALDNVRTEHFSRTLKYNLIYINEFETPKGLRKAINSYMHEYNTYRPHSSIEYLCPDQVYYASSPKLPDNIKTRKKRDLLRNFDFVS